MKRMRQKGESYDDIPIDNVVFLPGLVVVVIVAVVFVLFFVIALLSAACDNHVMPSKNERVAEFNAMTFEERRAATEWGGLDGVDPETYLMDEYEVESLFFMTQIHGRGNVLRALPTYFLVILVVTSIAICVGYAQERISSLYYFCSLPYDKPYGWFLLFCMFAGWPVFLVSFIISLVQRSKNFRAWREKRKQEKAAVRRLAEEELEEEARRMTRPAFPEQSRRAWVSYLVNGQTKAYKSRLDEAERNVEKAECELRRAGTAVRTAQQGLGHARAELAQLRATYAEQHSRQAAEADWKVIMNMRGVSSIMYNERKKRLEVTIKVRVPYKGELYDFGDYRFYIDGSSKCVCKEIRSGVKLTATDKSPHYGLSGNKFCFGSSKDVIEEYLGAGRYTDALILAVECLHSVNNEYDAEAIPMCFRKVSVVEKTKRRILLGNKLKNGKGVMRV